MLLSAFSVCEELACNGCGPLHGQGQGDKLRFSGLRSTAGHENVPAVFILERVHGAAARLFLSKSNGLFLQSDHVAVLYAVATNLDRSGLESEALLYESAVCVVEVFKVKVSLTLPRLHRQCRDVVLLQAQRKSPGHVVEGKDRKVIGRDIVFVSIVCVVVAPAYVDELYGGASSWLSVVAVRLLALGSRIVEEPLRFLDPGFGREVDMRKDIPCDVSAELCKRTVLVVPLRGKAEKQKNDFEEKND